VFGQLSFSPPPSGKYSSPLILKPSTEKEIIIYTTKGILPKSKLSQELPIDNSVHIVFKVSFWVDSQKKDTLFSRSYIFGSNSKFPIISFAIEQEDLWNDTTGIYVRGKYAQFNDSTGHWDSCNYQKNWEKVIFITYIEPDNTIGFEQRAGVKIFGESTRRQPDKSLKIIARKSYGKGKFKHAIFAQKSISKHDQLVIRTSGNDFNKTRFKDVLSTHLVAPMGLDYMAYQPIQLYVNGQHWGLYNLREKINEHFISDNYHIPKDSVNIIMGKWIRQHGRSARYMAMYRFFENVQVMTDQQYTIAQEFLDIRNYINYRVFQIFINNKDSRGNIRYWNANGFQEPFKMIVYDTDLGYGNPEYNYLAACLSPTETNWHNPTWATLYLRKLMTNSEFKHEFINQFAHLMNTTLHKDSIISQIDYLQALYYGELPQDKSTRPSHLKSVVFPMEQWNSDVEDLRTFARNRGDFIKQHLINVFELKGTFQLNIIGEKGRISISKNAPLNAPFFGIYFKDIPIQLLALNSDGYKFSHWSDGDTNKTKTIKVSNDSLTLTMNYIADSSTVAEHHPINQSAAPISGINSFDTSESYYSQLFNKVLTLEKLSYLLLSIGFLLLLIYFIWR
jgi:hypothetical protein